MKRCMFVDASPVIRKVARRILGGSDLTVVEAAGGSEALALCAVDMPDIIVVDSALADMPAVDFIRRARVIEAAVKPQIAISLIEFDVGTIMRAKRAGAQGYILKPFDRAQLIDRFRGLRDAA